MNPIYFKIYIHPQPKERPRLAKGRVYTPKKTWGFEQLLKMKFRQQVSEPISGPLCVEYTCHYVKPKRFKTGQDQRYKTSRPDIDNLIKSVLDAGNEALWIDDAQVVEMKCKKIFSDEDREFIEIIISKL